MRHDVLMLEDELSSLGHETEDNVAIWRITEFETLFEDEIEAAEDLYVERSGADHITATVVGFDDAPQLSSDV
jgi:hypothetical protein